MPETILVERGQGIAVVTLNRPDTLNALDLTMREELLVALQELNADDQVGAIIIQGQGRAFCAGGDINTMGDFQPNEGRKRMHNIQRLVRILMQMEKPVIAAVRGYAVGAGMNLALACDLVIASEGSKFCQSFLKIGLIPDCGGHYLLPRRVGVARAKELMFFAKTITAEEAMQFGIVNRVVPEGELLETAKQMAEELAQGPRVAIGLCKMLLNKSFDTDLDTALELEAHGQDLCLMSTDFKEGKTAFMEKRKPVFRG